MSSKDGPRQKTLDHETSSLHQTWEHWLEEPCSPSFATLLQRTRSQTEYRVTSNCHADTRSRVANLGARISHRRGAPPARAFRSPLHSMATGNAKVATTDSLPSSLVTVLGSSRIQFTTSHRCVGRRGRTGRKGGKKPGGNALLRARPSRWIEE